MKPSPPDGPPKHSTTSRPGRVLRSNACVVCQKWISSGSCCEDCTCRRGGCYRPVHMDPLLGPFNYCSPACRNEDLLPKYDEKLDRMIRNIKFGGNPLRRSSSTSSLNLKTS